MALSDLSAAFFGVHHHLHLHHGSLPVGGCVGFLIAKLAITGFRAFSLQTSDPAGGVTCFQHVTCGKRLHNYGKSPFLMGKSTINGHFQ